MQIILSFFFYFGYILILYINATDYFYLFLFICFLQFFAKRLSTIPMSRLTSTLQCAYPSGENSRLNTPPVGREFACSQSHEAMGFMPQ